MIIMINMNALRAEWVKKGLNQADVARIIGITPKTLSLKIKRGIFGTDEVEKLICALNIVNPMSIFFDNLVTFKDTKRRENTCQD